MVASVFAILLSTHDLNAGNQASCSSLVFPQLADLLCQMVPFQGSHILDVGN